MKNVANTIEDFLEILAGLQGQAKIQIESSDATIMYSIARQVFKGIALTDRQYALAKEKMQTYRNQFTALDYDFDRAVDTLRLPLRHIDRSKFIKIVNHSDIFGPNEVYESYKSDWKWIKIRFPFSKKTILKINDLSNMIRRDEYYHSKGSHEHYFMLNEYNLYNVMSTFNDSNFEVSDDVLELFKELETMHNNKKDYIPGIYNYKLKNLNNKAIEFAISSLGEPTQDNIIQYKDRQEVFGLSHVDIDQELLNRYNPLTVKIVNRDKHNIFLSSNKYNITHLTECLLELNRFPLLVILPNDDPLSGLKTFNSCVNGFIDPKKSSVMFRLDNNEYGRAFNSYIKDNNLNNTVDNDTQIVYINNTKLPKPLLQSDWQPCACLILNSFRLPATHNVLINELDLVIHYDETMSQFMRNGIQEL